MKPIELLNSKQFSLTINRLCYQLIENHDNFENAVIIGLQPRGIFLAARLKQELEAIIGKEVQCGALDITFYRDDFRRTDKPIIPSATNIDFSIENKTVILVDDVFYTGRTVRSGLDAMLSYGRPKKVELMALIERRFNAELPLEPNYIGKSVDSIDTERVLVEWKETEGEDKVLLYRTKEENE